MTYHSLLDDTGFVIFMLDDTMYVFSAPNLARPSLRETLDPDSAEFLRGRSWDIEVIYDDKKNHYVVKFSSGVNNTAVFSIRVDTLMMFGEMVMVLAEYKKYKYPELEQLVPAQPVERSANGAYTYVNIGGPCGGHVIVDDRVFTLENPFDEKDLDIFKTRELGVKYGRDAKRLSVTIFADGPIWKACGYLVNNPALSHAIKTAVEKKN